jgi:hypothetical protein
MGHRYTTEDRILGGSMEPRLNPEFRSTHLNSKLGPPNLPSPMVKEGCLREHGNTQRRRLIGLPPRFDREV